MADIAQSFTEQQDLTEEEAALAEIERKGTELMLKQIEVLLNDFTAGDTTDLVATLNNSDLSSVVTLDKNYLNDPTMSDLIDGKFKILGKVIKKVEENSDSISLLRKSSFNLLSKEALGEALNGFNQLEGDGDLNIKKVTFEVCGPAFQIIPIAIYA